VQTENLRDITLEGLAGAGASLDVQTVRASPSAAQTCAAIRSSVRRVAIYVAPMVSINRALDRTLPFWMSPH
jgi:hypothetical protein